MIYLFTWCVLGFTLVACVAFAAGRRMGQSEGRIAARHQLPIELRMHALDTGVCPICHGTEETVVQCGLRGD